MKRYFALLLVLALVFCFVACSPSVPLSTETPGAPASAAGGNGTSPTNEVAGDAMDFSGRELVFGVWGGTFADAAIEAYAAPFEKLTGAKITIEEYGTDVTAKVVAQKEQGIPGYDIICGCGALDQIYMMSQREAVLRLDYTKLPNAAKLPEGSKFDFAVGQYVINTCLAWRTDVYGDNPPDTVAKYFDVKNYPGNRGMVGFSPSGVLEQALLAQGVSKADLYPVDVKKAYEYLDIIKPFVTKWWSSGAEIRQSLADGEVDCGFFWGGSVVEGIFKDGMDNVAISHDAASLIVDCMAITSACQDVELAYAFLDYCLSAEAQAAWSKLKFYSPVNPDAYALIDSEMVPYFSSSNENIGQAFWCDVPFWQENFEALAEEYLLWIAS